MPQMPDALYQTLLDTSSHLIARVDRDLSPLYMNDRLRDLFLLPMPDAKALKTAIAGVSQDYLDFVSRNVEDVFARGEMVQGVHTFCPPGMRMKITGHYFFWPEFGPDGQVASVLCTFTDYNRQISTSEILRFNQRRLQALHRLTLMNDAPEEEALQFVAESLAELTGSPMGFLFLPKADLRGKGRMIWSKGHCRVLPVSVLPDDHFPEDCFHVPKDASGNFTLPFMFNGDGVRATHFSFGDKLPIMRGAYVAVHDGGRIVCLAAICNKLTDYDADDLRQMELFLNGAWSIISRRNDIIELKLAKENAERANRVKDQFLANVSHELRTPLNGMLSMLQLLELCDLEGQQLEYARTAALSGQALLRILSDILDFSRMELGRMELFPTSMDIAATVRSVVNLFAGEAKKKGIDLMLRVGEKPPSPLIGDEARIRQILFNLIGNALKFTEQGVITVECSPLSHNAHGKSWVYLMVCDTGPGMARRAMDTIFEPFTQIDGSSTRKNQGTGLGLSIVKKLVTLMDGVLSVESEKGFGTAVHLSLPLDLPHAHPPCLPPDQPRASSSEQIGRRDHAPYGAPGRPAGSPALRPMDILVAEDDSVSRFSTRIFLQRLGHRALCVPNGRLALEALKLYPFHCLITDIQMPEMDGLEVIARIRESSHADVAPGEEARRAVSDEFPAAGRVDHADYPIPADLPVVALTAHAIAGYREMLLDRGMDAYLPKPVMLQDLASLLERLGERIAE